MVLQPHNSKLIIKLLQDLQKWFQIHKSINKTSTKLTLRLIKSWYNNYPLPRINDILADCAKGKIWGTIDMTDSFFQTCIHPDNIHESAVSTPLNAFK